MEGNGEGMEGRGGEERELVPPSCRT